MIESLYRNEFNALCEQYTAFGYVVLDDVLIDEIKVLNNRYAL